MKNKLEFSKLTEEAKEQIRVRFVEEVSKLGTASEVARSIYTDPQKFYNFNSGTKPSLDTILSVWMAYPAKFNIMYVITGSQEGNFFSLEQPMKGDDAYAVAALADAEQKVRKEVEEQYKALLVDKDRQIQVANERERRMWDLLGKNEGVNDDPAFAEDQALFRLMGKLNWGVPLFK